MSFDNYNWQVNPEKLEIKNIFNKTIYKLANGDNILSQDGSYKVVKGEGYFIGESCMQNYLALEQKFEEGSIKSLTLPNGDSFDAVFKSLTLQITKEVGVLNYSFEFEEIV